MVTARLAVLGASLAVVLALGATPALGATRSGPATARAHIDLQDMFKVGHDVVTVPGRPFRITGVLAPYFPGQKVTVRVYLGHQLIKSGRFWIKRYHHKWFGYFSMVLSSPGVGHLGVWVEHKHNNTLGYSLVHQYFTALDYNVGPGARGEFVQLLQQQLARLHFYIPQTGVYDEGTGWAVDAYHRLLRHGVSQSVDGDTIRWILNGWGQFPVRYPSHGKHAEGNLGLQLLALINGSHVYAIYPISSGKPSTPTVLGSFHVYQKDPGYLPDGMYYSSFFYGNYAIHGFNPAPDYPASHGCMRVPIMDAISIYDWLQIGDGVDSYY